MKPVNIFVSLLLFAICIGIGQRPAHAASALSTTDQNFLNAIDNRDTAKVTQLLHDDPSLANLKLDKGRTPLLVAIDRYSFGAVIALLAAGADVNARDDGGVTPLIESASKVSGMVPLLIQKGADVNARDNKGNTPLTALLSSSHAFFNVLPLLLTHGANVNAPGIHGFTPLRFSVEPGEGQGDDVGYALAKTLLEKGGSYGNAFLDAVAHDDPGTLARLARARPRLVNERYAGVTPLDQAVFWQNMAAAKWLLLHGADVNAKNDRGETPLVHLLAEVGENGGDGGLISVLVAHHANVNIRDPSGQTPLAIAANIMSLDKKNAAFVLGLFLAHGANINAPDRYGVPLLTALTSIGPITSGYGEATKYLFNHGASYGSPFLDAVAHGNVVAVGTMLAKKPKLVATTDAYRNLATMIAYYWGRTAMLSFLLSHGAQINTRGFQGSTLLSYAMGSGDLKGVAYLLSKGADVNPKPDTGELAEANENGGPPLELAIEQSTGSSDVSLVALLLAHGADPRYVNPSSQLNPLGCAVFYDAPKVIELLLQKGVDVNDGGNPKETPLHMAIRDRRNQIALLLRQHGGKDGASPLIDAVTQGDTNRIRALVKSAPASLNTVVDGEMPLCAALYWGDRAVVSLLLDLGADPNLGPYPSVTPLIFLADVQGNDPAQQDDSLAALLIARRAEVNRVEAEAGPGEETALNAAATRGNIKLTTLLLKAGARVDVPDIRGVTPVFSAVLSGNRDMISLLLDNGAAINVRDIEGNTALHYLILTTAQPQLSAADKRRLQSVVDFVRQRGGTE